MLVQDNTLADRPMVELLTMLMHMLDMARHSAAGGGPALNQLVLILADGRFHEKESLRRVVEVRMPASETSPTVQSGNLIFGMACCAMPMSSPRL